MTPLLHGLAPWRTFVPMQIAGLEFTLSTPYSEGHICTASEAQALADRWAEAIFTNFRPIVVRSAPLTPERIAALRAQLADYASTFTLSAPRLPAEEIAVFERAVRNARIDLEEWLHQKGIKLPDREIAMRAEELAKIQPRYLERARMELAVRRGEALA